MCRYDIGSIYDTFSYLTNTAQSIKDAAFQEENSVLVGINYYVVCIKYDFKSLFI